MNEDSLLQQVRAARDEYARAHGYDVRRIVADLREWDGAGGWPVVRLTPRKPRPAGFNDVGPVKSLQTGRE
jgi:hypothetical protein